jgi:hypothetical protein
MEDIALIVHILLVLTYLLSPFILVGLDPILLFQCFKLYIKSEKDLEVLKVVLKKNDFLINQLLKSLPPEVRENILKDCFNDNPELYIKLIEILKGL